VRELDAFLALAADLADAAGEAIRRVDVRGHP